jgi:hypothetical protein
MIQINLTDRQVLFHIFVNLSVSGESLAALLMHGQSTHKAGIFDFFVKSSLVLPGRGSLMF